MSAPAAAAATPAYGAGYSGAGYSGYGYPAAGYGGYGAYGGTERAVVGTEQVVTPVTQTVMVPQTTYQQRIIQVPQAQQVKVPKMVSLPRELRYA